MKTRIFIASLCLAFMCSSPLASQAEPFGSPSTIQSLADWESTYPGPWVLRRSEWNNRPRLLFGGSIPGEKVELNDRGLISKAWGALCAASGLFEYDTSTLKFGNLKRHHFSDRPERIVVGFSQYVDEVPVEGGVVAVVLHADGTIVAISSSALMAQETFSRPILVSKERAKEFALATFSKSSGIGNAVIDEGQLCLVGPNSSSVNEASIVQVFNLTSPDTANDAKSVRYWVRVDSMEPVLLAETSLIKNCHAPGKHNDRGLVISGTLETRANPGFSGLPDDVGGLYPFGVASTVQALPNARVSFPSGSMVLANQLGFFSDPPNNGSEVPTVSFTDQLASGGQSSVRVAGSLFSEVFTAPISGVGNVLLVNSSYGNEDATAASNAFLAIQEFRSFASSQGDQTLAGVDLVAEVSFSALAAGEAEFFSGTTPNQIRFARHFTGYANMAYSTVLAHELGHWANAEYGKTGTLGAPTGLDEGFADVWAMYIYGRALIAENYNGFGSFVRTGNNLSQKCVNPFGCYGDAHINGEPLMGALWKVRSNLEASGNLALANEIFLGIMTDPSINLFGVEDVIRDWWLIFDDGGVGALDFSDGTPNFDEINDAFLANGWPEFGQNAFEVVHTPLPDYVDDQSNLVITAQLDPNSHFQSISVPLADVEWKRNGVAQPSVPMASVGNTFSATLVPPLGGVFDGPDFVEYRMLFDYSVGPINLSLVSPEEGYHQVSIGELKPIYTNNFEGGSAQGWSFQENGIGLSADWQRGFAYGQQGTTFGGGVWFDPITAPSSLNPSIVWGTDLGETGLWNGEYNKNTDSYLLSPLINLPPGTTGEIRISFSRWLTKGSSGLARVLVENQSGVTLPPLYESALTEILDTSWRPMNLEFIPPAGATAFRLRFELEGGGADNAGGWTIDDLSIYTLGAGPLGGSDSLQLSGNTTVTIGDEPEFTVKHAGPGNMVHLYYSSSLGPTVLMGHTFDLGAGFHLNEFGVSPVMADASGVAVFQLQPITSGAAGSTIYLEAAVQSPTITDSNVLPLTLWN